ncbi:hypothetical protein VP01_291g3 [Puccinia sorghi]|uniref:Uncharacterized protein n=1 Tax=Puccinia sorghi TaxID=27349 RepID=A0A0L6V226_9BASI|nr:hypothetical protein VP01_291g3 [Puccinia sorghi]
MKAVTVSLIDGKPVQKASIINKHIYFIHFSLKRVFYHYKQCSQVELLPLIRLSLFFYPCTIHELTLNIFNLIITPPSENQTSGEEWRVQECRREGDIFGYMNLKHYISYLIIDLEEGVQNIQNLFPGCKKQRVVKSEFLLEEFENLFMFTSCTVFLSTMECYSTMRKECLHCLVFNVTLLTECESSYLGPVLNSILARFSDKTEFKNILSSQLGLLENFQQKGFGESGFETLHFLPRDLRKYTRSVSKIQMYDTAFISLIMEQNFFSTYSVSFWIHSKFTADCKNNDIQLRQETLFKVSYYYLSSNYALKNSSMLRWVSPNFNNSENNMSNAPIYNPPWYFHQNSQDIFKCVKILEHEFLEVLTMHNNPSFSRRDSDCLIVKIHQKLCFFLTTGNKWNRGGNSPNSKLWGFSRFINISFPLYSLTSFFSLLWQLIATITQAPGWMQIEYAQPLNCRKLCCTVAKIVFTMSKTKYCKCKERSSVCWGKVQKHPLLVMMLLESTVGITNRIPLKRGGVGNWPVEISRVDSGGKECMQVKVEIVIRVHFFHFFLFQLQSLYSSVLHLRYRSWDRHQLTCANYVGGCQSQGGRLAPDPVHPGVKISAPKFEEGG